MSELLRLIQGGDESARGRLFQLLYDDLHDRAQRLMGRQREDHTLQPTALVHEAFVKLAEPDDTAFNDQTHFLALASQAMRQVLVDHARGKQTLKRNPVGQKIILELVDDEAEAEGTSFDVEALDRALCELATFDAPMARAVELRLFGGSSVSETARIVGMSRRTFQRNWRKTLEWLQGRLA